MLTVWAFFVRLVLRRGFLLRVLPIAVVAQESEVNTVLTWRRVRHHRLSSVDYSYLQRLLERPDQPLLVAVSSDVRRDSSNRSVLETLEVCDPRLVRSVSVLSLFEQHQERLPPVLMDDFLFTYDDLPWAAAFSVQAQLKRMAELTLALLLLLLSSFILLSAFDLARRQLTYLHTGAKRLAWSPFYCI